jgi:type IV pilus secretin PilQ/predicted competence protein
MSGRHAIQLLIGLLTLCLSCSSDPQTQGQGDDSTQLSDNGNSANEADDSGNSADNSNSSDGDEFDDQGSDGTGDQEVNNAAAEPGEDGAQAISDLGESSQDLQGTDAAGQSNVLPTNNITGLDEQVPLPEAPQLNPVPVNLAPAALDAGPVFLQQPVPKGSELTTQNPYDLPSYDLLPSKSLLWWVGYDFDAAKNLVRIELVTRGAPRYDVLHEKNKAGQPELVVRFYETSIRRKVSRNIDASEFRSPVAYIRMRPNPTDESVDVILTLRDPIKPRIYAHNGNVLLTFAVPEKYKGNNSIAIVPSTDAELLLAADVQPTLVGGSDFPKSHGLPAVPNPSEGVFVGAPQDGGNIIKAAEEVSDPANAANGITTESLDGELQNEALNSNSQGQSENGNNSNVNQEKNEQQSENSQNDQNNQNGEENPVNQQNQEGNPEGQDEGNEVDEEVGNANSSNEKPKVRELTSPDTRFTVTKFGIASVAQDKDQGQFEDDFDNEADGSLDDAADTGSDGNGKSANNANGTGEESQLNPAGTPRDNASNTGKTTDDNTGAIDTSNLDSNLESSGVGNVEDQNIFAEEGAPATPVAPPVDETISKVTQLAPLPPAPETVGQDTAVDPVAPQAYRPVRLEFRGAKLKEVIRALGEENQINFTFPGGIGENLIFINFKDVPWDDALRAVLETNGLGMVKLTGGVVRIDTLAKLTSEKDELFRIRESASRLIPTKVLVLRLSYAQAEDVKKLVDDMLTASKFDKRVRIETDKRTNSVIIEATPVDLSKVKALVERIDLQTPQVQIASRIVEVLRSGANLFGIDWAGPFMGDQGRGLGFGNLVFPNSFLSTFAVDTGAVSNAQTKTGVNAHIGSINNSVELDLRLRLEESRGTTHILQNNSLIVEDNGKATIQAGKQDFFAVQTAAGTPGFTTVDYLLQLDVTPHITADGAVQMNLKIESSSPVAKVSADAESSRSQRLLQTSLLKNSGETAAIGGLYTTEKTDQVFGIPILSDIPIIGALFRTKIAKDDRRELIILVTPTIMSGSKTSGGTMGISSEANSVGESENLVPSPDPEDQDSKAGENSSGNVANEQSNSPNNEQGGENSESQNNVQSNNAPLQQQENGAGENSQSNGNGNSQNSNSDLEQDQGN